MGSSKTTGARKHQKTCLEIVLYSKIDFELASKQKCPHKEESLFLKFPFFCIPSEQSNWVSCHAPLFWLQEKNFFVLITRKSGERISFVRLGALSIAITQVAVFQLSDGFTRVQLSWDWADAETSPVLYIHTAVYPPGILSLWHWKKCYIVQVQVGRAEQVMGL